MFSIWDVELNIVTEILDVVASHLGDKFLLTLSHIYLPWFPSSYPMRWALPAHSNILIRQQSCPAACLAHMERQCFLATF